MRARDTCCRSREPLRLRTETVSYAVDNNVDNRRSPQPVWLGAGCLKIGRRPQAQYSRTAVSKCQVRRISTTSYWLARPGENAG